MHKHMYIYIYMFVCFWCFSVISMSAKRPIKWKLFLKFHHKNLYTRHFYFVRATCLTKHFELYLTTRRLQCTMVSWSISPCRLHSSSVNSSVSRRNTITLSGIKMHCFIFNLIYRSSEQMFLSKESKDI